MENRRKESAHFLLEPAIHGKQGLLCDKYFIWIGKQVIAACTNICRSAYWELHQSPYSPTILKHVLGLVLQIFLYLEAFERNTTSDWLNHTV